MSLSEKDKDSVRKAAQRESALVLREALDTDGFKHRDIAGVSEENYEKADALFFKEVEKIERELKAKGGKR